MANPFSDSKFLKILKPFFNFSIHSVEDVLSLMLGLVIFGIIVFQAYFMDITYDEAYTYLNTGRIQDVWKIYQFRIANTHFLNSVLMTLTTLFFPYNDFAIRLPSVLISGLYISVAISYSRKYSNRLIILGLLLLFYYLVEYMSLGRGYGMCVTFVLAALYVLDNKVQFKQYYLWVSYLLLLAIYSNYVAIAPAFVVMGYIFVFELKGQIPAISVKNRNWILGLLVVSLYGFFSVTREGKPLYGAYDAGFFEAIPFDFVVRFLGQDGPTLPLVSVFTIIIAIASAALFLFKRENAKFGAITLATFIAILLLSWVGGKPLPTGRVLIPFWPLVVLTLMELIEFGTKRIPLVIIRITNFVIFGLLIFNFSQQTHFGAIVASKKVQWKKPLVILADYEKEIYPHDIYYLEKDRYHEIIKNRLQNLNPDKVESNEFVISKKYQNLRLITLDFQEYDREEVLCRELIQNEKSIFSDKIKLNSEEFVMQEDYPFLLPYPDSIPANYLQLGNCNGDWSYEVFLLD